jgi:signal transduction histidine kinase
MIAFVVCSLGLAVGALAQARRRATVVARAGHEVRGGLCAALLALERLALEGAAASSLGALELELRRAAAALDDLAARRDLAACRPVAALHHLAARRPVAALHHLAARRPVAAEDVDVGALLLTAAPGWGPLVAAHGGELLVEAPAGLAVRADRARLAQACSNLVANAAEHGGGAIRVRARALPGAVRVEVTDDGPGLPAPIHALVASGRRRRGRRGHGLVIAASVARRHGGRLAAAPAAKGARLVLELPAAPPDPIPVS